MLFEPKYKRKYSYISVNLQVGLISLHLLVDGKATQIYVSTLPLSHSSVGTAAGSSYDPVDEEPPPRTPH